jgi:hypothetical protein
LGPEVRIVRSRKVLEQDPDYKLIEKCNADEFDPSLTAFDRMLDSLVVH